MSTITLLGLVQHLHAQLDMRWEFQPIADPIVVTRGAGNEEIHTLIGQMNCIHPNRIQVLGLEEITYLNKLRPDTRRDIIRQLIAPKSIAIIFADDQKPDPQLSELARAGGVAILTCTQAATMVVATMQQALPKLIVNRVIIHGVFMEVIGIGVLITGASGIGKSELALELLSRGHRLIADDAPEFTCSGQSNITGTCPRTLQDFIEVRGLGILNVRAMFGDSAIKHKKDLRLIVELQEMTDKQLAQVERISVSQAQPILDIDIPLVTIPVAPGRNLAIIVECAARNQILLNKGYNAAEAFSRQQRKLMENPES